MKKVLVAIVLLIGGFLTGCSSSSQERENSSLKAENSSLKAAETEVSIVGSYKDSKDGAAVEFNRNGTGRYVYADPNNSDTDDSLTWKKIGSNRYSIILDDNDVTSDLTGTLYGNQLVLSGDKNWNTESFIKTKESLNLDTFLSDMHTSGKTKQSGVKINSAQQAAKYIADQEDVDPSIVVAKSYNNGFIVRMDDHPTRFVSRNGNVSVISGIEVDSPATDGNGKTY